jgi:hypothetical protein
MADVITCGFVGSGIDRGGDVEQGTAIVLTFLARLYILLKREEMILKFKTVILVLSIIVLSNLSAAQTKVGTAGATFLELSPSVRANGMGEAGVALVDNYSYYFNPASLGLLHNGYHPRLTLFPKKARPTKEGMTGFQYFSFSTHIVRVNLAEELPVSLNMAYYLTRLKTGPIPITTYDHPEGTGLFFDAIDKAHNITLGAGASYLLDFAAGVNFKVIHDDYDEESATGTAVDFGFLLRIPSNQPTYLFYHKNPDLRLNFSATIGVSWCNIGGELEMASASYPIPEFKRWGISAPLGMELKSNGDYRELFLVTPALEILRYPDWSPVVRYGMEISVMEAVAGRIGMIEGWNEINDKTWGFGLKSRGIFRLIANLFTSESSQPDGSIMRFFRRQLDIEFDFARRSVSRGLWDRATYHYDYYGISISL